MKPAFVEILNYYSNKDTSVMIYLKKGNRLYLEDGTTNLMNITNITIASYSDILDIPDRATIIPTRIPQLDTGRTVLHILNDFDLKLDEVIAEGGYTDSELLLLDNSQVTFQILRSSVYIDDVNFEREPVDLGRESILINLIYLQDNIMSMTNMDINVTGALMNANDPFNGFFENITIDAYGLTEGFNTILNCNYPEASLQNEVRFNYVTAFVSFFRENIPLSPQVIYYQGPGNATISNSYQADFSSIIIVVTATNYFYRDAICQPDDDLLQIYTMDNITISLIENDFVGGRQSANVMNFPDNLYRKIEAYMINDNYFNFEESTFSILYMTGEANSKLFWNN